MIFAVVDGDDLKGPQVERIGFVVALQLHQNVRLIFQGEGVRDAVLAVAVGEDLDDLIQHRQGFFRLALSQKDGGVVSQRVAVRHAVLTGEQTLQAHVFVHVFGGRCHFAAAEVVIADVVDDGGVVWMLSTVLAFADGERFQQ